MKITFPPSLRFAMLPTPIERLGRIPKLSDEFELLIKRDDLTGFALSGNKVRKLEFLVWEALKKKCDTLITCGGAQSNHARATAIIAAQLGLKPYLVLFRDEKPKLDGNLFLDKLTNAEIKYISSEEYKYVDEIMEEERVKLKKRGNEGYVIPEGGSNALGIWGYIQAAFEMKSQTDKMNLKIDQIVTAVSSGGTYAGLYLGAKFSNWRVQIIGFNIRETAQIACDRIWNLVLKNLERYKFDIKVKRDEILVIGGYVGKGYGLNRKVELDFIKAVAKNTGIILDQVYSGKALFGLVDQMKKGGFSKKDKVLFLHTGGGFGLFPIKEKLFR